MKLFRKERMESLLREELALMVARELEFKDMFVTVTNVVASPDLEEATVKISVLPGGRANDALAIIQSFARRFHGMLVRKLNIRPIPHIKFEIDHGLEKAAEVEKKLIESDTEGQ